MRNCARISVFVLLFSSPIAAKPRPQQAGPDLSWAYNAPDKTQPAREEEGPVHVPGSNKAYTRAQVNDVMNPPDWIPDAHAPAPTAILHGSGAAIACGSCHLMSGLGHPQSANLTGFTVAYFLQQMADFKSGARKTAAMPGIAAALSDEETKKAAEWFASLKPKPWTRVVESDTAPKSYVDAEFMRVSAPGGGTEPLGERIIEVPEDTARAMSRDPNCGFVAYVPKGSIARGKELVENGIGGIGVGCTSCHGASLEGMGQAPPLAGMTPLYMVRQIVDIQSGARAGNLVKPMIVFVKKATVADMIAIAAYAASLSPR